MIKYRTRKMFAEIEKVEVVRETKTMVFFDSSIGKLLRGEKKRTEFQQYHDTWDLAKKWLMAISEYKLDDALEAMRRSEEFYRNVRELDNPEVE